MAGKIWRYFRGASAKQPVRVDFFTRRECPLCEAALHLLRKYETKHGLQITLHDVDEDPELVQRHGHRVPVIVIEGKERFWGKINDAWLTRTLNGLR